MEVVPGGRDDGYDWRPGTDQHGYGGRDDVTKWHEPTSRGRCGGRDPGPIYDSAKRAHRFGGRNFMYHGYGKLLMLFVEGFCRRVRFGKRTRLEGYLRGIKVGTMRK